MTPELITLSHDIRTDVGTISAGTTLPATIAVDVLGWQVEMSLPGSDVPSHSAVVKASAVRGGKARLNSLYAHHDYQFAREFLGYSHLSAIAWIREGYGVGERQLYRWGFTNQRSEVAA